MPVPPPKTRILEVLGAELEHRLRAAQHAAADAYSGATHEESRAEDKYDTRALEQSYLTAGQTARIAELRQLLTALHFYQLPRPGADTVQPGALVEAIADASPLLYFLLPLRVGERLLVDGAEVQVVGTAAPLAQALLGKTVGECVQVQVGGSARELEILSVS